MIREKRENLIKYSLRTLKNKNLGDVQTNVQKAIEAFCTLNPFKNTSFFNISPFKQCFMGIKLR